MSDHGSWQHHSFFSSLGYFEANLFSCLETIWFGFDFFPSIFRFLSWKSERPELSYFVEPERNRPEDPRAQSLSLSLSHTEPTRSHTHIVSLPHAHTHIISLSFLHKHTLLVHTRKHLFQNQMSTEFRVEGFWVLPRWQWNRTLNNEQILEETNKNQESRCENKFMYLVKVVATTSSILFNHSFKYLFSEIFHELRTGWLKLVLGYNWTCSWMPFLWELSSFGFKVHIKDKENNWLKL